MTIQFFPNNLNYFIFLHVTSTPLPTHKSDAVVTGLGLPLNVSEARMVLDKSRNCDYTFKDLYQIPKVLID